MGLLKYFGEHGGTDSEHNERLHWPGTLDGFPFRGTASPNLKQEEIEELPLSLDFHCQTFELWKDEDRRVYVDIRDRAANQWYQIVFIDRQFDKDHGNWRVYVEWNQISGELPEGKSPTTNQSAAGS